MSMSVLILQEVVVRTGCGRWEIGMKERKKKQGQRAVQFSMTRYVDNTLVKPQLDLSSRRCTLTCRIGLARLRLVYNTRHYQQIYILSFPSAIRHLPPVTRPKLQTHIPNDHSCIRTPLCTSGWSPNSV
jgi:hypothetical protein